MTEVRKETKFSEGGKRDRGDINTDRLRRGKKSAKVIIEETSIRIDSGEGRRAPR